MSDMSSPGIADLTRLVDAFVKERDWQRFHTPRQLASAIAIEAAELMEVYLWKSDDEVGGLLATADGDREVARELADIVILCLSMSNRVGIDLATAVIEKIRENDCKYPAPLVRGRAEKYTHYVDHDLSSAEGQT